MRTEYALYFLTVTAALVFVITGCGDSASNLQPNRPGTDVSSDSGGAAVEPTNAGNPDEIPGQALCPVMGGKINKAIFTDYKGKRIYFCCPPCVKTFESDPEKYMKALEEMENNPAQAPSESGK